VVHNHAVNPNKFHPRGIPCVYVGTGSLENVHGGKFLDPATGKYIFSTNMTVVEHFLPFREVLHNPAAVRDCFGVIGFRNMVGWMLVNHRVRKCFDGTWHIGIICSFNLRQQWFSIQYSDGLEGYTPSEVALAYFGDVLPRAFHMAFDIALPLGMVAVVPSLSTLFDPVVFDLKICPEKRTIQRFKARIVANGKDQLLGFDCFNVHSPTIPMCELNMILAIAAQG
jgi:hypothetical protein